MTVGVLFHGADLFDVGHEGPAASIEDGDLGAVHFDEGIVDAAPVKGGEEVLGGVDAGVALFEGRPAPGLHDEVAVCRNGVPVEVHPLEHVPVVRIGRLHGQCGVLSGVEANAFKRKAAAEGVLAVTADRMAIAPEGEESDMVQACLFSNSRMIRRRATCVFWCCLMGRPGFPAGPGRVGGCSR